MARGRLDYTSVFRVNEWGEPPMLNVMRDNLKHLKWVLIIVALAMLGYLGAYFDPRAYRRATADWAARVDGETVTSQELVQVARQQDEFYRRLLGQQYDAMKKNLKLGSQAIQSIVDRRIVLAEARSMGLAATKEEISRQILDNPSFKDAAGNFVGKERYTAAVEQSFDGGVAAYESQLADDLLAHKWLSVMTASARVSDDDVEHAWRKTNEKVAFDYVFVPVASVPFDTTVEPAAASAWYRGHLDSYKRAEARRVKLLVVDRQAQLQKVKVGDDEVRAEFDARQADYQRPEQRHVRHILLKLPPGGGDADKRSVRDLAASVLARAKKGEDFAALARSMSQDPGSAAKGGDLGWFGRGQMVKPFDDAAFTTAAGQFAPIVETEYGFHVLQVLESRAAGAVPFEEAKESIRRRLELQKAQDAAVQEAERLKAQIKSPADLETVAAKAGLKVEEKRISADDRAADLGPSPEFQNATAALAPGQVSSPLGVARGIAIVACVEIVPPAVQPQSEVTDRVKSDLLNDRGQTATLAAARRIAAGATLEAGAKSLKLEVKKSGDVAPGSPLPGAGPVPDLDRVVFAAETSVGARGAASAQGGAVAYLVTRHDAFDPAKFQAEKEALRQQLLQQERDQMIQGIVESLRQKHTVEVNKEVVDSLNG
jgi:peptidyl-prolyl cis-trans isomerase D